VTMASLLVSLPATLLAAAQAAAIILAAS